MNPFEVLQVQPDVTEEQLKKTYRKLARKYHPDVNDSEEAALKFQEIKRAYDRAKKALIGPKKFVIQPNAKRVKPTQPMYRYDRKTGKVYRTDLGNNPRQYEGESPYWKAYQEMKNQAEKMADAQERKVEEAFSKEPKSKSDKIEKSQEETNRVNWLTVPVFVLGLLVLSSLLFLFTSVFVMLSVLAIAVFSVSMYSLVSNTKSKYNSSTT